MIVENPLRVTLPDGRRRAVDVDIALRQARADFQLDRLRLGSKFDGFCFAAPEPYLRPGVLMVGLACDDGVCAARGVEA